jgi:hypothetical protein
MSKHRSWCAFSFAAFAMASTHAIADVVSLTSVKDNTLYQDASGALSNGAGEFLFAGTTGTGLVRRGLIAFDLASVGLPGGSTINSVTLTLHMSQTSGAAADVSLHNVLGNWGEGTSDAAGGEGGGITATLGDATWLHTFYSNGFWSTAGGDFNALASATTSVNGVGFYSWSSAQMLIDVQQWLSSPGANFGWLLHGNEAISNTTKRFDSRESVTPGFRPVLTIDYTPVPGPAALALLIFAPLLRSGRNREKKL